ncbi:MAG TPA: glycogen synthase GlgA [Casimicrobiaceae bacterium]|nr:glycogen synthase GlgA [Casimicrobiaceae bacterium]
MTRTGNALRILFATSEAAPWVKTGGLGDVAAALSAQLRAEGHDVRLVMPAYRSIRDRIANVAPIARFPAATSLPAASLAQSTLPGDVPVLLIDCPSLFDRDGGPYLDARGVDWPDNAVRFALLSTIAAKLARADTPLDWQPDILHCNDWQTGPAPAMLHCARTRHAKTVMTVHNLAFQGVFEGNLTALLGLPRQAFDFEGIEFHGKTSFMKAGLMFADRITTVSPTYAREIQHAPLGFGLQGVLARRADDLIGILNGIDEAVWNPADDPHIDAHYDADSIDIKVRNKTALQRALELDVRDDLPLFGVVTRLTEQKGSDLVATIAARIAHMPAQLVVLGAGDSAIERALRAAATSHPRSIAVMIGFDEALAHRIEAGCDAFLMPSRFEPSGLNQMYSQRYGSPPIAHATGGLRDSIVDTTPATLAAAIATGFLFDEPTVDGLWRAVQRAATLYEDKGRWRTLQRAGMKKSFGWSERASEYVALYRALLESRA